MAALVRSPAGNLALVTALAAGVGLGGPFALVTIAAIGLIAFAIGVSRPMAVVALAVFTSLLPWPPGLEPGVGVLGGTLYVADLLIGLSALLVMTGAGAGPVGPPESRSAGPLGRGSARGTPVGLAAGVVGIGIFGAVVAANAPGAFLRDVRGPLYLLAGVTVGMAATTRPRLRLTLVRSVCAAMWVSAAGVLVTIATGLPIVGGKIGEVSTNLSGVYTAFDAVRFRIAPTQVALMVLTVVLAFAMVRPPGVDVGALAVAFAPPCLVLTFLSFSRSALVALALTVVICAMSSLRWSHLISFSGRGFAVIVVAVLGGLVLITAGDLMAGAAGNGGNPVRSQVEAYQARVLDVLGSDKLNQDASASFRRRESGLAVTAIHGQPLAGAGFGAVYRLPMTFEPFAEQSGVTYVHNYYLWIAIKTGLVGLALTLALLALPILRWLLWLRADPRARVAVPFMACVGGVIGVLYVEPVAQARQSAAVFGGLVGVAWALTARPEGTSDSRLPRKATWPEPASSAGEPTVASV